MSPVRWTRSRSRVDPVLTGQIVLAALLVCALASGVPGDLLDQGRLSWFGSVLFQVGTVVAARRVRRLLPPGDPARRFWRVYWLAGAAMGLAQLSQLVVTAGGARTPEILLGGPVALVLVGGAVAGVVIVISTYPLRMRTRREYACYWLDMATVLVGAAAFGWYFTARPTAEDGLAGVVTGPVLNLVAVFVVAKMLLVGRPPFSARAGLLGICGPIVGGAASALGPALIAHGHGNWYFVGNLLGDVFIALAAQVQGQRVAADPAGALRRAPRPYTTLPYFAVGATFVLLAVAVSGHGLAGRGWAVLVAAAISTGLVIVRQLASFADNARLLGELDRKVEELRAVLQERDVLAAQLHKMAYEDGLTGLANRMLFHDRLTNALARGRRDGTRVAVMLLDLDDFKPINDGYGHAAGDAVLKEIGKRLRECLHETDTAARLGGDEFGILLEDLAPDRVSAIAKRVEDAVREPYLLGGRQVRVGVSVGVAYAVGGGRDADELLGAADAAMYETKCRRKNGAPGRVGAPATPPAPAPGNGAGMWAVAAGSAAVE